MENTCGFVHLHTHTMYSLLDGAIKSKELISLAKKWGMGAAAITDHGNMFGAMEFYLKAKDKGIKPIIGSEIYVAIEGMDVKRAARGNIDGSNHLVLLAATNQGYRNLMKIVSAGYLEGFYYKPRVDKSFLREYAGGLIALSACIKGEIPQLILQGHMDEAEKAAKEYVEIFGEGNFYLEIMENGLLKQKRVNRQILNIAKALNIPLVATNNVHYINREEALAPNISLCIRNGTTLAAPGKGDLYSDQFYLRSPEEMADIFREIPEAVRNTLEVADRCNLVLDFSRIHLPRFPLPEGEDADGFLDKLCRQNLPRRYEETTPEIEKRLSSELGVIRKAGLAGYFLVFWDLVRYAGEQDIPVGPGRGPAGGSMVNYVLGITGVDPLKYNLIFERFFNPQRDTLPDIDIDFCFERRNTVLAYIRQKYGEEKVAGVVTFGRMRARGVLRDVGRAMGGTDEEVNRIVQLVPYDPPGITLDMAIQIEPKLTELYKIGWWASELVDNSKIMEGLTRYASTHTAGVIIGDRPLVEYIPLFRIDERQTVTGFDMDSLKRIGLPKLNILGLKTLTVIGRTVKKIKRTQGIELDIDSIPLGDERTYGLLSSGETLGVFQLESTGMRDLCRKIKPRRFEDLIALIALFRPGPMRMLDDFIKRKNGCVSVRYEHPLLEPILEPTYGIMLYQEQVMQILNKLAGFDMSKADLCRRAMSLKDPEVMDRDKGDFVKGCLVRGIRKAVAEKVFADMERFAGYCFNKSHAITYALIAYQAAYLKTNFPAEFMSALLASEKDNTDKLVVYIDEAKRMGIDILTPDVK